MGQFFHLDSPLMQGLGKLADLILLNILALVCSLPLFTLGASAAGLYHAMNDLLADKGHLARSFFRGFRENFKQATLLWLILLALGLLLFLALWFYLQVELALGGILVAVVLVLAAVWCLMFSWTFPLQAKFVNTVRGTLRNALLCALAYLPRSLGMAVLNFLPLALFLLAPQWFFRLGPLWLLVWFSLAAYFVLKLLKKPYAMLTRNPQAEGKSEEKTQA